MFNILLITITGTIAMSAAYFSIIGIASIFAANYTPALRSRPVIYIVTGK